MMINLLEGERIDDLERDGYKIIQNSKKFCFGMDAVLLSGFANVKKDEVVLDLGTGTGVIPILLEAKTEGKHFSALEIQDESADMARRSVELNCLQDKIEIVNGDIKEASKIFGRASFDVVTTNPPYMNDNHGLKNPDMPKAIARHEVLCSLEDVVREASYVLKERGRFYMVHRPHRMVEIINIMTKYKLEPKRIRMVHPYADKEANMILIEGLKGGNGFLKVEKPLIVYKEVNVYTEDILKTYKK
ncbi:MAG: tRNA1(Val) (adenine(37)-N6)-methyltransferase [Lachnospiraceae bacterium]|nr:tRNA1(Val) (adenine(37)-N6)-methyltransferase [Lachnospiraceae bacterium]MDE6699216.1 tRNA1(Val) (adenine(37)-N6)-methyltransferase [Lachnospiraceae bacterium]